MPSVPHILWSQRVTEVLLRERTQTPPLTPTVASTKVSITQEAKPSRSLLLPPASTLGTCPDQCPQPPTTHASTTLSPCPRELLALCPGPRCSEAVAFEAADPWSQAIESHRRVTVCLGQPHPGKNPVSWVHAGTLGHTARDWPGVCLSLNATCSCSLVDAVGSHRVFSHLQHVGTFM